jgi:hypothetical protein
LLAISFTTHHPLIHGGPEVSHQLVGFRACPRAVPRFPQEHEFRRLGDSRPMTRDQRMSQEIAEAIVQLPFVLTACALSRAV